MAEDKEFSAIKREIHNKILELHELQKEYRALTGREYVISGPLQDAKEERCNPTHLKQTEG